MKTLQERFDKKWIPEPNSGCWLWIASIGSHGYGQINVGPNLPEPAHRVAFRLYKGPLVNGDVVRHRCDNKFCVNPDHLEKGTHADNAHDRAMRGQSNKGKQFPQRWKVDDVDVLSILQDTRSSLEVAAEYGISRSYVYNLKQGLYRAQKLEKGTYHA